MKRLVLILLAASVLGFGLVIHAPSASAKGHSVVHGVYHVEDHYKTKVRVCIETGGTKHFKPHPCKAPHKAAKKHTKHLHKTTHKRRHIVRVKHWYRVYRIR